MTSVVVLLGFLFAVLNGGAVADVPSFVTPCSRNDADCIKAAAQTALPVFAEGFPEFGIAPLDPFPLEDISVDLAGLKFVTSGASKGFKGAQIDKVLFDFKEKVFTLNFRVNTTMKGHYKASGQLLFLPINGEGDIKIKTVDAHLDLTSPFEVTKDSNGKEHIHFTKTFDMKFDVKGNVHYTLTNLFQGNKDLSDAMHAFLNTNWKLISNEFAIPVVRPGIQTLFDNMNHMFEKLPLNEMFTD